MCGITGVCYKDPQRRPSLDVVKRMSDKLVHRGPDDAQNVANGNAGFGFRRLSIIDLVHGSQPFYSNDGSVMLICNGEIYNYKELRAELSAKGYVFNTNSDIEVLVSLYVEYGNDFLKRLNGQFAMALFDSKRNLLLLAKDHFGICPLFYTLYDDAVIFASEIKAILEYPGIPREVNLSGLDQIFTFPAAISPATLFKGIYSLEPGTYAVYTGGVLTKTEYWDLEYPEIGYKYESKDEAYYVEGLNEQLLRSVKYRVHADVPVGFYLSGGLDSSLIGGLMYATNDSRDFNSFSISFSGSGKENKEINEQRYQHLMSKHLNSTHNDIDFSWGQIDKKLREVVYFSESPLKETYNVCSLALSEAARARNVKVVLCGEGADELFGGYAGYKFDTLRMNKTLHKDLDHLLEDKVRNHLWGNPEFTYEKNEHEFREVKSALYSNSMQSRYGDFDCLKTPVVNKARMKNRHIFHQRSYVDFKLRLGGHLIADHGDRMALANSVESRYPFLDVNLIDYVTKIPPGMMLQNMNEKFLLKQVAKGIVPNEIIRREKFGFVAPGSVALLKANVEWINDLLSYDTIKRQGFFNPDTIERLKKHYMKDDFVLTPPYDLDLLIIVLTFNIFLDTFQLPSL